MSDVPAHKILAKLFQTIVDEAERNPDFAQTMLDGLPEELKATNEEKTLEVTKSNPVKTKPSKASNKPSFDPSGYNPLVMVRERGEDLMRIELKKLTTPNLKAVIKHFNLKLAPHLSTKSPNKTDLIKALIAFAKHYDQQRKGAAR